MITVITPTGGRPEAFRLCEFYMSRQTIKPDQWIVVDDCPEATECNMGQQVIRPQPFWQPGDMTLPRNIYAALGAVRGQVVLIMEDDDWYAPNYIEIAVGRLQNHDLIGEGCAKYYNIQNFRMVGHSNRKHASLCQTVFSSKLIPKVEKVVLSNMTQKFLDLNIWKLPVRKKIYTDHITSVGIKGMPGRGGIGYGHTDRMGSEDVGPFKELQKWIGEDYKIYENLRNSGFGSKS